MKKAKLRHHSSELEASQTKLKFRLTLRHQGLNENIARIRQRNFELINVATVAKAVAHELDVRLSELEDDFNNAQVELARREDTVVRMEEEMNEKDAHLALVRDRYPKVYECHQ